MKMTVDKLYRDNIVKGKNIEYLKKYIEVGCDVNQTWGEGSVKQGNGLIWSCFLNDSEFVNILCNYIDVNATERGNGHSALHYACRNGNIDIINILLENGANIDHCDVNNETGLHLACWRGLPKVVECLLKHGANINVINLDDQTPLQVAKKYGKQECVEMLEKYIDVAYNHLSRPNTSSGSED